VKLDIFTTSIHHYNLTQIENLRKQFELYALNDEKVSKGNTISNVGGHQSKPVWQKDLDLYDTFCKNVLPNIFKDMTNVYKWQSNHIQPMNCWFNVNRKGDYNLHHRHGKSCDFSAVYYVKVPDKNTSHIVFDSPDVFQFTNELQYWMRNKNNQARFKLLPKQNDLIIFPAHIQHFVEQNNSDDCRITMAFNIRII